MFKNQNDNKDFVFMHCFKKLQGCKKWDTLCLTLHKDGEGNGPKSAGGASTGPPSCNKKAKVEKNVAPALAAMDASLEKMISSFTTENKEAADRAADVWKSILDKQDMKIALERERVEAAKMEAHAAAMKATNEAKQLSLAKMTQESKILMADIKNMDPLAMAWHEMIRDRISQEVMAARVAFVAPPTTVVPEPVMEVPPMLTPDDAVFPVDSPSPPFA
jgi:hypothetical protein